MPAYSTKLPVRGIRAGSIILEATASDPRVRALTGDLARRLGLPPGTQVHRRVQGQVWLPRHGDYGVPVGRDETTFPAGRELRVKLKARDYQTAAADALVKAGGGVLEAPCGSGKTITGLLVLARLATRALVLVHTRDLLAQWVDRAGEALHGVRVAQLGDVDEARADIVVAMVPTLARWTVGKLARWGAAFGAVILDEAHHAPALTFTHVIGALPARWRIGLTATPDRADGLGPMLLAHFGPVAHRVSARSLAKVGATMTPSVRFVRTGAVSAEDPRRDGVIRRIVAAAVGEGRTVLVLVRLVEHAQELGASIRGAHVLVGEVSPAWRKRVLDGARAGRVRVIVATSLADEGLDVDKLDTLILATRTGIAGRLRQRIGRIQRPGAGKRTPLVVDLVDLDDTDAPQRERLYRSLGCPVAG